jgi:hypothetical protein
LYVGFDVSVPYNTSKTSALSGLDIVHLADGGVGADLLPITGNPFVDCTPSSKSIISVILFDLKSSVDMYIVYVLPTDILVNEELKPTFLV